ncbi:MAG: aspartate aminotransferase family protein [Asticcacaulis sp.]|uniref:aspartate aminotransferase family protein n=1 Tax=Asticcacaulis sp. TaxID=1872648 RepID=UPI0039E3E07C
MTSRDQSVMINAYSPDLANELASETRQLIERRNRLLGPAYRLFYEVPLHFVRGQGVWLYDADDRPYLDAYNNVASLGHCRPEVVEAIAAQAAKLNTHTRYLHETILDCAEQLLSTMPDELGHVMFTCTGSESNDLALRIARAFTGNAGVIVTELAYHGVTDAISQLSPALGDGVPRGPHIFTIPSPLNFPPHTRAEGFRAAMQDAMVRMRKNGYQPAAFFCDTLFSSDGIISDPPGFLKDAVISFQETGGLFVADEVQAGFGRTGDTMWGFQRHGIVPDMVTMGKPMGNGHPVGAVAVKPELLTKFGKQARYFNTFGGNPVSCAAALATLAVLRDDRLIENARIVGSYLLDRLRALAAVHSHIGEVRGTGLFIGMDIVSDRTRMTPDAALAAFLVNNLRENRILISATGPGANVLKIRPPLVLEQVHADQVVNAIDRALELHRQRQ